jgi:hypothetical protein
MSSDAPLGELFRDRKIHFSAWRSIAGEGLRHGGGSLRHGFHISRHIPRRPAHPLVFLLGDLGWGTYCGDTDSGCVNGHT